MTNLRSVKFTESNTTAFGAMSDGRSIQAKANKTIHFNLSLASGSSIFSPQDSKSV